MKLKWTIGTNESIPSTNHYHRLTLKNCLSHGQSHWEIPHYHGQIHCEIPHTQEKSFSFHTIDWCHWNPTLTFSLQPRDYYLVLVSKDKLYLCVKVFQSYPLSFFKRKIKRNVGNTLLIFIHIGSYTLKETYDSFVFFIYFFQRYQ